MQATLARPTADASAVVTHTPITPALFHARAGPAFSSMLTTLSNAPPALAASMVADSSVEMLAGTPFSRRTAAMIADILSTVTRVFPTVADVLPMITHIFPAIPDIFAPVVEIFTAVTDILSPVPGPAVVPGIPDILAAVADVFPTVADIFAVIPHVLPPVVDILPSVTDVFTVVADVLQPIVVPRRPIRMVGDELLEFLRMVPLELLELVLAPLLPALHERFVPPGVVRLEPLKPFLHMRAELLGVGLLEVLQFLVSLCLDPIFDTLERLGILLFEVSKPLPELVLALPDSLAKRLRVLFPKPAQARGLFPCRRRCRLPGIADVFSPVSDILAMIAHVLAMVPHIFAAVVDVLAPIPDVLKPVPGPAIVPRVPHVLPSVPDILAPVVDVFASVPDILSPIADVFFPIGDVLRAVTPALRLASTRTTPLAASLRRLGEDSLRRSQQPGDHPPDQRTSHGKALLCPTRLDAGASKKFTC